MSLRALNHSFIPDPPPETVAGVAEKDVTVAFAFDSGYLMPFKVMIHSLYQQGTLLDCPIAIYSDDPKVFEDPVVKAVADRSRLIDGAQRDQLYELARTRVKRPERSDWNKGTFLKWAVFEEQSSPRLLFLDVDMICLAPLAPLFDIAPGCDLVTAPQFQTSVYIAKDKKLHPKATIEETLLAMLAGTYSGLHLKRVNSGMMLLGTKLLTRAFYDELVLWSHREVLTNEQLHISSLFGQKKYSLHMAPAVFNFQERYLNYLGDDAKSKAMKGIKILHYAGNGKPWKKGGHRSRISQSPSQLPWFVNYFEAAQHSRMMAE